MADDKKSTVVPISGVAILLAALGITFFSQAPYKATRPEAPQHRESYQKVDARLWQDPFRAVVDHLRSPDISDTTKTVVLKSDLPTKQSGFCFYTSTKNRALLDKLKEHKGKVTVLGVMVSGSRYEEDSEMRTRYRYAVLSGLSRVGFVPEDAEHLEYMSIGCREGSKPSLANIMPYEWLISSKEEGDKVLLLWLNDDVFGKAPLAKLGQLAGFLGIAGRDSNVKFKIIGPAGSTRLKDMYEELEGTDVVSLGAIANLSNRTEIFSPAATVDDSLLLPQKSIAGAVNLQAVFKRYSIGFHRTIGTDRELAEKLISELSLRRVNPITSKDHILLVSEWDTDYGRSLPDLFKKMLEQKAAGNKDDVSERVHLISYMRGIDGTLPGDKEEKKDEKQGTKSSKGDDGVKKLEQAVGKSQLDYLRRLADETHQLEQDLAVNGRGSVKAIGVLGSDPYDKYLVIQALRQRFPQAIYFTTDLDARFLHPDWINWTRNLLVASSFGFSLRNDATVDLQGSCPPFRSNYQTSAYYATLLAFSDSRKSFFNDKTLPMVNKEKINIPPCIFEIGWHKAVNLSNVDDTIHPKHYTKSTQTRWVLRIVMICFLLIALLFFSSVKMRKYAETAWDYYSPPKFGRWLVGALVFISFVATTFVVYKAHIDCNEEPFSLLEGVSSWPSELIRFAAIILAIFFMLKAWKDLKENKKCILKLYFGESLNDEEFKKKNQEGIKKVLDAIIKKFEQNKGVGRLVEMLREYCYRVKFNWEEDRSSIIDQSWQEYVLRDSFKYRIMRLVPIVLFYVFLCISLIAFFGFPVKPIRGNISYTFDMILLTLNIASFTVLVFYVFDVTLICRQFIDTVSDKPPHWSGVAKQAYLIERLLRAARNVEGETDRPWSELRLVQLIAKRTEAVGQLIFYPFIIWFLLFIARINYFDNWQTPLGLAAVFLLSAVYAWSCAFFLRRAAEDARMDAIRRLNNELEKVQFCDNPEGKQIMQIRFVIEEIKAIHQGAFLPFMQHPVIQALFVPFGGVSGVYLLEFLSKLN